MKAAGTKADLEVIDIDPAAVIRLRGEKIALDHLQIQVLGDELLRVIQKPGRRQIILDMSNVEYLNGSALALLLTLNRQLQAVGGWLTLENLNHLVLEIFAITKLDKVFDIRARSAQTPPENCLPELAACGKQS